MLIMYASVLISGVLPCRRLEPEKKRKKNFEDLVPGKVNR